MKRQQEYHVSTVYIDFATKITTMKEQIASLVNSINHVLVEIIFFLDSRNCLEDKSSYPSIMSNS